MLKNKNDIFVGLENYSEKFLEKIIRQILAETKEPLNADQITFRVKMKIAELQGDMNDISDDQTDTAR